MYYKLDISYNQGGYFMNPTKPPFAAATYQIQQTYTINIPVTASEIETNWGELICKCTNPFQKQFLVPNSDLSQNHTWIHLQALDGSFLLPIQNIATILISSPEEVQKCLGTFKGQNAISKLLH